MDQEDIHPPAICILCHKLVSRYQEAIAAGQDFCPRHGGCVVVKEWTAHSEISCTVCAQCQQEPRGHQPRKRRRSASDEATADVGSSSSDMMQVGTAIGTPMQVRTATKKQVYEAEMGSTASALDDASETSATDLHWVEDLFKIATPDYRSNDDCILSPDRLSHSTTFFAAFASTLSTEESRQSAVITTSVQNAFGRGFILVQSA